MKKILLALIILSLLVCPLYSQDAAINRDAFFVLDNFGGMLKSYVSPFLLSPKDAIQALNVRMDEKYGAITKRPKMFLLSTAPTSAVKTLYRYYKSDDTKYTIATYSTNVSYINESGTETVLWDSATDTQRWTFVTYKDSLIGLDGYDNTKKWDGKTTTTADTDGARSADNLMTDLGAPFAELNTGTDLTAEKWYQYKVAYYDGSDYTYSTARSNPILTGASVYNIYLTDIPLGPSGTTQRIIYRTAGQTTRANVIAQTSFYRVATISDNSTRVFADTVSDATLVGDTAPTWATVSGGVDVTPPKSKFALINAERLFLANDPSGTESGKSTVYWSDTLNPDYFNYLVDYELVRPDDGDEITFIKSVLGIPTIGKTRSISKFYTDNASTTYWSLSDPFSHVGCVAPYSAVNGLRGVIYLGRHGIYLFNGQTSSLLSNVVTDKIRDILETAVDDVVGVFHDNKYLMAYASEESGAAVNNRVLVFDAENLTYYQDIKNIDSFATFDSGTDFGTLFSGSSASDGNIYAHKFDFSQLIYRYKSEFDAGTSDSVHVSGTESTPIVTLASDETWAESTDKWEDSGSKTWVVDALAGYWYSPIIQIDAAELDKLFWNEYSGATGNITWSIRTGATEGACNVAAWSSELTDSTGSDLTGLTANDYIQLRATLTTADWQESPRLYSVDSSVAKMTYKKEGTTEETAILSIYETGKINLGQENPVRIKELQIFYEGTAGTLNLAFYNEKGEQYSFDIDLSVEATDSGDDEYFGSEIEKIYVYIPNFENNPIGRFWTFKITEEGTDVWRINRIFGRYDINSYTTFK